MRFPVSPPSTLLALGFGAGLLFASTPAPADGQAAGGPSCIVNPQMDLEGRASPLDSTSVAIGGGQVKLCYGAPSARGRTMIGGEDVPFGTPWRTGANEPTTLHTTVPLSVAGIRIDPGSYVLYTVPGAERWEIVLNSEHERWGVPITAEVRAHDVGTAVVDRERPDAHVERLHLNFHDEGSRAAELVMEWEEFRIRIPVTATGG